jgi:hypothetical protein
LLLQVIKAIRDLLFQVRGHLSTGTHHIGQIAKETRGGGSANEFPNGEINFIPGKEGRLRRAAQQSMRSFE